VVGQQPGRNGDSALGAAARTLPVNPLPSSAALSTEYGQALVILMASAAAQDRAAAMAQFERDVGAHRPGSCSLGWGMTSLSTSTVKRWCSAHRIVACSIGPSVLSSTYRSTTSAGAAQAGHPTDRNGQERVIHGGVLIGETAPLGARRPPTEEAQNVEKCSCPAPARMPNASLGWRRLDVAWQIVKVEHCPDSTSRRNTSI
jgi:hypothetical protein